MAKILETIQKLRHGQAEVELSDALTEAVQRARDTGKFSADIHIACAQCNMPFRFLGLPYGSLIDGAAVSVDGTEARMAIEPRHPYLGRLNS